MTHIVIEQDLWEEDVEGVITAWLCDEGDRLSKGDIVAEVMVEKVQHEVLSPCDGILGITIAAEEAVKRGDVIGDVS